MYRLGRLAWIAVIIFPACSGGGVHGPMTKPDVSEDWKAAAAVAQELLAHFGPDSLDRFTWKDPGSFQSLIEAGVLSKEDAGEIRRHGFQGFEFRRSVAFSRRYEFSFRTAPDQSMAVELNHRGESVMDGGEQDLSTDLPGDVKRMWSIDEKGRSTQGAILAGSRVFNTVNLVGMHRDRIVELIGDFSRRPGGYYNFPFHPAGRGDLVYRFDNGAYGGNST